MIHILRQANENWKKIYDMNILVTTFGTSWAILPELLGYTNPGVFDFYRNHPARKSIDRQKEKFQINPVDEIWVIHTDSELTWKALGHYQDWHDMVLPARPVFRFYCTDGISDMGTEEECKAMSDLIFRTVFHAKKKTEGGKLFISLTGGRKNMSADIQRASDIFGCSTVLHLADNLKPNAILRKVEPGGLQIPLDSEEVAQINPMVVFGEKPPHPILYVDIPLAENDYPLKEGKNEVHTGLLDIIDTRLTSATSLIINHHQQRIRHSPQNSFYGLHLISPRIIASLEQDIIGLYPDKHEKDLQWLKSLPKAELHCHIGGILDAHDMVEVASCLSQEILQLKNDNSFYQKWMDTLEDAIIQENFEGISFWTRNAKKILRNLDSVPEPMGVVGFLSAFKGREDMLDRLIFGSYQDIRNFIKIGITAYEKLGDLQGSGLLKHPKTLEATCEVLKRKCREQNIRYCELRCSPANYTGEGFSVEEVVNVIHKSLSNCDSTIFRLIIIGSRHNSAELLQQHVKLAEHMMHDPQLSRFIAGFDIAGNESISRPLELKESLSRLLHDCVRMTIHAGEGEKVENIWEAAYELNSERIGHGLTLVDNPELMKRFMDRKIAVEMCPSSNLQIIGYKVADIRKTHKLPVYPLKHYFDKGIRVTVNTDNPGISRTSLSGEYLLAARMSPGGLSKWDILKLIRNSFKAAFLEPGIKKEILLEAEKEITDLCTHI